MPLTDTVCRNAKPTEKIQKLSDGGGLHLQITLDGHKYWRMHYRFSEKQKTLAFGVYPDVSLLEAREKRAEAKALLKQGIDPSAEKKRIKHQRILNNANTFEQIAKEWHAKQQKNLTPDYWKNQLHRLEMDIFPEIGSKPIKDLQAWDVLAALQKIEKRGAHEMARRAVQVCSQIFSLWRDYSKMRTRPHL